MPRSRSFMSIAMEAAIVVVMMGVVGHLGVNFWERYIIQTELSQMKNSLTLLKTTLFNIGNAYDKLHTEMKGLTEITMKKNSLINTMIAAPDYNTCLKTLDRRRLHDIEVNAVIEAKNNLIKYPLKSNHKDHNIIPKANTKHEALNFPPKSNAENDALNILSKVHKRTGVESVRTRSAAVMPSQNMEFIKNTTTMTRHSQKSTGAGHSYTKYADTSCKHPGCKVQKIVCYEDTCCKEPLTYLKY